ncbi:MAG: plastocyanin/azurin family copper-binding protein, partial [Chloroflexi bacterium]|nr:plastocyanin/azurin family copper-binding protein [Chloroflexota bacterium]
MSAVAFTIVLVLAACGPQAGAPTWTFRPAGADGTAASAEPSSPTSGEVLGSLEITSVDLGFEPKELSVDAAGRYEVTLMNHGAIPHDITFPDGTKLVALPGDEASAVVAVPEDGVTFLCSIPGHADAGMRGTISVKGSTAGGGGDHGGPVPATDVEPDPNAPPHEPRDPVAPERLS